MAKTKSSHPFRRDPLEGARFLRRWLRLLVYPGVGLLIPLDHLLFGLTWNEAVLSHLGGYVIAVVAVELAMQVVFRLRKEAAYPSMLAVELGPVHDLNKACQKGVEMVASWLKAHAAVLVCLQRDGEGFEAMAAYNLPANWMDKVQTARFDLRPFQETLRRERVLVEQLKPDDAWSFFLGGNCLAAYIPIMSLDTPIGVLSLVGDRSSVELRDTTLLTALGMVLGLVLDNIRLYDYEYQAVFQVLCAALDRRDQATEGHSRRVADLALAVGRELGLGRERLKNLERAAILHDIGKIVVPDHVLSKPGPLMEEEWVEMRKHPLVGYEMVRNVPLLRRAADIIYAHHEHFDGRGYPNALQGEEIPLEARIFAVVDAYDAITSERPYRRARPHEYALEEIRRNVGSQFDPQVVEAFLEADRKGLIRSNGAARQRIVPLVRASM